ncbi:MAG: hypothetical protein QW775_03655 [Ignisphaera sp.]|uniref:Alpha-L-arabinofuranosidase 1 catalytic domain-containing protein n=1 Tax=Ignisphaera aggregans TaxID=334771 RepID=A0A7C4NLY0_9CREN
MVVSLLKIFVLLIIILMVVNIIFLARFSQYLYNATAEPIGRYSSGFVEYFKSPYDNRVYIEAFAENISLNPISRYLFGIFLEHHGDKIKAGSIYHGIWAEILDNPSFESAKYFGVSVWDGESIAYAWLEYGSGNVSYHLVKGYCIGTSQRIEVKALNSEKIGVKQGIYLPIHRINVYVVELWLRGNVSKVIVSLEKKDGGVIAAHVVENVSESWAKHRFNITVPKGMVLPGEEILLVIATDSIGWLEVDHVSLMPIDNVFGFDPDVIKYLREAGITLIRWPGGNFASQYHWKDGIGSRECRPIKLNRAWNIPEYNYVGIDEFIIFTKLVGAEPLIVVNAGWDGTVEEALEWVEYTNGDINTKWGRVRAGNGYPEPYNVIWWELGNELYGHWQIGFMSNFEYAQRYKELYEAMKAKDHRLKLIANGGLDNVGQPHSISWMLWDQPLLESNSGRVEYLSRHYLIWVDQNEVDYYKAIGWTFAVRERWKEMKEILKKLQDPLPKIAITEAQGAKDLDVSTTMIEALWVAGLYNSAIYSDGFVEVITRSSLMWFGGGLRKTFEIVYPTPALYVHKIYATQPGKYPVALKVSTPVFNSSSRPPEIPAANDVPYVDAVALFNEDRSKLSIIVVNYHTQKSMLTTITLSNYIIQGEIIATQLKGKNIGGRNTWRNPENIKPINFTISPKSRYSIELELPPLSVTLLIIPGSITEEPTTHVYTTTETPSLTNSQTYQPLPISTSITTQTTLSLEPTTSSTQISRNLGIELAIIASIIVMFTTTYTIIKRKRKSKL